MLFNNKIYDILKYLALVGLPAFGSFWMVVGAIWNVPHTDEVVKTIIALATLLGALLVISDAKYQKSDLKYDGTIDPYYANAVTAPEVLDVPALADRWRDKEGSYPDLGKKQLLLKVEPMHDKVNLEEH